MFICFIYNIMDDPDFYSIKVNMLEEGENVTGDFKI